MSRPEVQPSNPRRVAIGRIRRIANHAFLGALILAALCLIHGFVIEPHWLRVRTVRIEARAIDRSPWGTGTCARMAVLYERGELPLGRDYRHEGILGTVFTGRLLRETTVGDHRAVIPALTGSAWITGVGQYVLDPSDPFPEGFRVGDIWGGVGEP